MTHEERIRIMENYGTVKIYRSPISNTQAVKLLCKHGMLISGGGNRNIYDITKSIYAKLYNKIHDMVDHVEDNR